MSFDVKTSFNYISFLPGKSNQFITGSVVGRIKLWKIIDRRPVLQARANSELSYIRDGAVSFGGNSFVLTDGKKVEIWDIGQKGKLFMKSGFSTKGIQTINYSKSGNELVAYGENNLGYLFDLKGKLLTILTVGEGKKDSQEEKFLAYTPEINHWIDSYRYVLQLMNEFKFYGEVWELDNDAKEKYGIQ